MEVWIHTHKIPPLYRTLSIMKYLVGRVGKEIEVEVRVVSNDQGFS
jgi:hypothetical protein